MNLERSKKIVNISDEIEKVDQLATGYDVFKYIRRLGLSAGFEKFSVISLDPNTNKIADQSVVNNWDPELIHVYDEEGLASRSPVLDHAGSTIKPLSFELKQLPQERPNQEKELVVSLFNDFKMQHSCILPVRNSTGQCGAIVLSGDRKAEAERSLYELQLLSNFAYDKLVSPSNGASDRPEVRLSDRERDCLTWTAGGKTSAEIGIILGISDHTVTYYLTAATKKLDAVNRVQAVAKAIRMGLLQ